MNDLSIAANKPHMNYFSRQIISREVEIEKMRRAGPKFQNNETRTPKSTSCGKENVPNHLRTLNPKAVQQNQVSKQVSVIYFAKEKNSISISHLKSYGSIFILYFTVSCSSFLNDF